MKKRVLISSLEPSANLHLNEVLRHLDAEICGIFDEKFGTPLMPSSEFSAMGFFQVLPLIFKAKKAIKEMVSLAKTCDEILLIDSPAFNLPLAKALKKANVKAKITYYILPKVWAWKKGRAKKVDNFCDNLASILPFDAKFFKKAKYAGNPLLDEISVEKLDYSKNKTLAFLPGSRRGEISKLMPIFREVAKEFRDYRKILVVPKNFENLEIYGEISDFLIEKDTPKALAKSEFAFICSGTATLEAAIVGTPFVLCYKAKSIDIFIAKLLVGKRIKFIGLANIFYQFMGLGELHTELIQSEVTKENLIKAYKENKPEKFIEAKRNLREYLKFGSAKNVANMIEKG